MWEVKLKAIAKIILIVVNSNENNYHIRCLVPEVLSVQS